MSTQHTPELFAKAAAFYEKHPTGQYDNEAAHALRCHHELLKALKDLRAAIKSRGVISTVKALSKTDAAIAKAMGAA